MSDTNGIPLRAVVVIALVTTASYLAIDIGTKATYAFLREDPPAESQAEAVERVSLETQYDTSIHEAGHVIEDYLRLPRRGVDEVWIYAERPKDDPVLGLTVFPAACEEFGKEECLRRDAMTDLAGLAAEEILLKKKPPELYEDKDRAGSRLLEFCDARPAECGECPADSKVGSECLLKGMMLSNRSKLYERVKLDVEANKETIVALANALFRKPVEGGKRRLTRAEIEAFLAAHPLVDPSVPKPKE